MPLSSTTTRHRSSKESGLSHYSPSVSSDSSPIRLEQRETPQGDNPLLGVTTGRLDQESLRLHTLLLGSRDDTSETIFRLDRYFESQGMGSAVAVSGELFSQDSPLIQEAQLQVASNPVALREEDPTMRQIDEIGRERLDEIERQFEELRAQAERLGIEVDESDEDSGVDTPSEDS